MGPGPRGVEIVVGVENSLPATDVATGRPFPVCADTAMKDDWRCQGYGAATCEVWPCVRSYNASMASGKFEETLISTLSNWSYYEGGGIYYLATVDTECLSQSGVQNLKIAEYQINPGERWLPYNFSWPSPEQNPQLSLASDAPFPQSMLKHECLYLIDQISAQSLYLDYLYLFFSGTVTANYTGAGFTEWFGPQNLLTIYNFCNITFDSVNSTFQNISDSMTAYVRQHGNVNQNNPTAGIVLHIQTCLEVRLGFIAYPAACVFM